MALVSKSKAAKLASVSRTTIHRYVKNGKLSANNGEIETSELIRVFGDISETPATPVQPVTSEHDVTPPVTAGLTTKIRAPRAGRIAPDSSAALNRVHVMRTVIQKNRVFFGNVTS